MGSEAHIVVVDGPPASLPHARRRLRDLESRWSRFQPDSEVTRLNEAGGAPMEVTSSTWLLLRRACDGWALTEGRFDPTILHDLEALGYDRSFEKLEGSRHRPEASEAPPSPRRPPVSESVHVSPDGHTVQLASGVGFDPGGVGKGLAADLLVAELLALGAEGASVNVGGDLRVEGEAPTDDGWIIDIEDPHHPERTLTRCALRAGAVATSSRLQRTWERGGTVRHHLVDPRDGHSVRSGLASVTVVAGEGWLAEVLTKAAFIAGPRDAAAVLDAAGAAAVLVDDDGAVQSLGLPIPEENP